MGQITKELLESKGYKECDKCHWTFKSVNSQELFQKRITDENGSTKYFIDFVRHQFDTIPSMTVWNVSIQFTPKGYDTINVQLVQWFNEFGEICNSNHTIEEAEELCEKIFNKMEGVYYER